MRPSKPHGFIAWLCDLYVLAIALGAVLALGLALLGRPGSMTVALGLFAASLLVSILYHLVLAKRVSHLSPGELIAGRFFVDGGKVWLNPYSKTRWPVFLVAITTIVIVSNTWDAISAGVELPILVVLGRTAMAFAVVYCVVLAGRGRPRALIAVALYWVLVAGGAFTTATEAAEAISLVLFFAVPGIAALLTAFFYSRWLAEDVGEETESA